MISPAQKASEPNGETDAILAEGDLRSSVIAEVHLQQSDGRLFDARALLSERPELEDRKSIVVELAYEEFCQRIEAGESVDCDAFCRQFPACENSLQRLIEVHQYLDENPHLAPPMDVDWPEPGQTFRGFSLLAELGRGTFGRVYLANERALGSRLVAIKLSFDGTAEAGTLGRLQHPNIVPVYSVWQDDASGLSAICMPYLGRVTLLDVMDRLFGKDERPMRSRAIIDAVLADGDNSLPGRPCLWFH